MFGSRLPLAESFAALLATEGVTRGLIGPREVPRLWDRHLVNCALVTEILPVEAEVVDVGSGAGLPGLVLAVRRPDLRVTLVEPLLRRTTFLHEAVDALALDNVEVLRTRAEALHGTRHFDVVTSRAVAPLPRLLDWCMPLAKPGGHLVAMKGSSAATEVDEAADALARWTESAAEVLSLGAVGVSPPTTVVRVQSGGSSRLGWAADTRNVAPTRRSRRGGTRPGRGRTGDAHG